MIRPITCICMMLAAASGLYLYQFKHRTQMLDKSIEQTLKATEVIHERTRLLSAEWALLNDPSRLGEMAGKFLTLRPVAPNQFVTFAELDKRLPAVQSYAPAGSTPPETAPTPEVPLAQTMPPLNSQAAATTPDSGHVTEHSVTAPTRTQSVASASPKPTARAPAGGAPVTALVDAKTPEWAKTPEGAKTPDGHELQRHEAAVAAPHATLGAVAGPMATPVSNPVILNPVLSRVMATNARPRPGRETEYATANAAGAHVDHINNYSAGNPPATSFVPHITSALGGSRSLLAPPVPVSPSGFSPDAGLAPR